MVTTVRHRLSIGFALAAAGLVGACGAPPSVDEIPAGTEVAITTEDGDLVRGALTEVGEDAVVVSSAGAGETRVERNAIAEVTTAEEAPEPIELTVPAGATLPAELRVAVASSSSSPGDPVEASLTAPLDVEGRTIAPAGSILTGRVTAAESSGRVSGRAMIEVQFDRLRVGSVTHEIRTDPIRYVAESTRGEDARTIGIGAGIGAAIGAIAGGGQGAATGAAIGAGGGTAVVLSTSGDEVDLDTGTALEVRLASPFTVVVSAE